MKNRLPQVFLIVLASLLLLQPNVAVSAKKMAALKGTSDHVIPAWFKVSFLDLKDDVKDAKAKKKRLLVYFGQEGCPYCARLFNNNFSQAHIKDYTRKHFDALAINMWGDREVTAISGKTFTEKAFAKHKQVWFTPTMLFYDENAKVVLRINGYFPPHKFLAALRYVAEKHEKKMNFSQYLTKHAPVPAAGKLHKQSFFKKPPYNLKKRVAGKPIMILFEQKDCSGCDYMHKRIFTHNSSPALLKRFQVIQLDMWNDIPLVTLGGKTTTAKKWAQILNISYAPSAVFFVKGKEVMRIEAYLRTFHFQSVMDYVATGAYRKQPSFQRYISKRADHLRENGVTIDLWK